MTDRGGMWALRKTPGQSGKRPTSSVARSLHAAQDCTFRSLGSSRGRCSPTLPSRAPQTEMSAACRPLSLRRKRCQGWLSYSGLKESQSLGVGPQGAKTLSHHLLPRRFWSSPSRSRKVDVGAKRPRPNDRGRGTGEGAAADAHGTQGHAAVTSTTFPGCGDLVSGLCRAPPRAKTVSHTDGPESEIY